MWRSLGLSFLFLLSLVACLPGAPAALPSISEPSVLPSPLPSGTLTPFSPPQEIASPTPTPTPLPPGETPTPEAPSLPTDSPTPALTATPTLPAALVLDPAGWRNWPVLPTVTEAMRQVYLQGQLLGNDPHAFSVFGDCQSEAKVFLGRYASDPAQAAALPAGLQETVAWFHDSLNRASPTVRGGTTTGALLWSEWHQFRFTCTEFETPLQCELRIHHPSFVILHVGSHYESRNEGYMRTILEQLLAAGVVPILASKADNRELDGGINLGYAGLAVEYGLPFWNFWAAVEDLPNRGLYTLPQVAHQGDLYLTEAAQDIHRLTALQSLEITWRAVTRP